MMMISVMNAKTDAEYRKTRFTPLMKLQQLRYLAAVVQNGLNITAAAEKLHTSQPAVSKQIKLLEDELGFRIFVRSGRTLTKVTPAGQHVVDRAVRVLREVQNIKGISEEHKDEDRGTLSIGTTHTQARYVLPAVIQQFRARYPNVRLHLHQGTSEQIAEMAAHDRIDFAIATGSESLFGNMVLLPAYQWHRQIVVPLDHPLASIRKPTLKQVAAYPVVTYVFSFTGPSSLQQLFAKAGLTMNVALTARDSDVIKTYVRLGLGVGIVADVAVDAREDRDLVAIDASHLLPTHTTWIGFSRGGLLRRYMYDFLQLFAPHLSRRLVDRTMAASSQEQIAALFTDIKLPVK
jgi:LysR family cys regulon transcriptional activator